MNHSAHPASPVTSKTSVAARRMALTRNDRAAPRPTARFSDPFGDPLTGASRQRDPTPVPSASRVRDRRQDNKLSPPPSTSRPSKPEIHEEEARYDVQLHRQVAKEKWVRANEPKPIAGKEFRIALRMLITEAAAYHARNGSSALNCRIAGALLAKNRGMFPTDLPVDVHSSKISSRVVLQLFTDVDNICDHYQDGPRLALQALQEMSLWRQ